MSRGLVLPPRGGSVSLELRQETAHFCKSIGITAGDELNASFWVRVNRPKEPGDGSLTTPEVPPDSIDLVLVKSDAPPCFGNRPNASIGI